LSGEPYYSRALYQSELRRVSAPLILVDQRIKDSVCTFQ
jgi:hypothetical protein